MIVGDFNAKLANTNLDNTRHRGIFGLGIINEREKTLTNYLQNENLYCMNTFFKKPEDTDGHGEVQNKKPKTRLTILLLTENT